MKKPKAIALFLTACGIVVSGVALIPQFRNSPTPQPIENSGILLQNANNNQINIYGSQPSSSENAGRSEMVIVWQDAALEACFRDWLSMPEGEIYPSDLSSITELEIHGSTHVFVNGADQNGESSHVSYNMQNGMPIINGMEVKTGNIKEIGDIWNLRNLEVLTITHNQVANAAPLNGMDKLQFLSLTQNRITSDGDFPKLASIQFIDLSENLLRLVPFIPNGNQVRLLNLSGNQLHDISMLSSCMNVEHLDLSMNQLEDDDISILKAMEHLQYLDVSYNQLKNLPAVESEPAFQDINLKTRGLIDLEGLMSDLP